MYSWFALVQMVQMVHMVHMVSLYQSVYQYDLSVPIEYIRYLVDHETKNKSTKENPH
jgi:hypothetical protein